MGLALFHLGWIGLDLTEKTGYSPNSKGVTGPRIIERPIIF